MLWWKDFANERRLDDGRRWLLFPLVIPPADRRIGRNVASTIPAAPDSLAAELKQPDGKQWRCFLLTAEQTPMRIALTVEEGRLNLPRISHFALLVIEETTP